MGGGRGGVRDIPGGLVVKNRPPIKEMQKMQVRSLSQEDPPEKETATTPECLPGKSLGQRSLTDYCSWGPKELNMTEHTHVMCGAL